MIRYPFYISRLLKIIDVIIEERDNYDEESTNIFLAMNVIFPTVLRIPMVFSKNLRTVPCYGHRRVVLKLNTETLKASTPAEIPMLSVFHLNINIYQIIVLLMIINQKSFFMPLNTNPFIKISQNTDYQQYTSTLYRYDKLEFPEKVLAIYNGKLFVLSDNDRFVKTMSI